jgi:hypothetical protein
MIIKVTGDLSGIEDTIWPGMTNKEIQVIIIGKVILRDIDDNIWSGNTNR